jgi:quinol monooxygenase YgiN
MSVVVVATLYPLEEHAEEVCETLKEVISRVHSEDEGCELYALHRSEGRLVMIEKWTSSEALAAHSKSDASRELSQKLAGKLSSKGADIQVLEPLSAGDPQLGAL